MPMTVISDLSYDQEAWNKALFYDFNEHNVFDQAADVKPTSVTNPGATVTFFRPKNLTGGSDVLDESTDVTPEALDDDNIVVSLYERGHVVQTSQLLRLISMVPVEESVSVLLGQNAGERMDELAAAALASGTNVHYSGFGLGDGSRDEMTPTNKLSSADVRRMRNRLRRAKVPRKGGRYNCYLHSDVLLDFREETGGIGWIDLVKYTESGVSQIYTDEVGAYEGFRFIETVHSPVYSDAGSSPYAALDLYGSLFCGGQALAKGFSNVEGYGSMPIYVPGPVTDGLRRFVKHGWKHFVGYDLFREESVWRVESASSVGDNAA